VGQYAAQITIAVNLLASQYASSQPSPPPPPVTVPGSPGQVGATVVRGMGVAPSMKDALKELVTTVPGTAATATGYPPGAVARYNKTRKVWTIYGLGGTMAGLGMTDYLGNCIWGDCYGLGQTTPEVEPPAPGPKIGEEKEKPAGVPNAGDEEDKKPLYKKWWFWTAIGGGVVVLGTGGYFLLRKKKGSGSLSYAAPRRRRYQ